MCAFGCQFNFAWRRIACMHKRIKTTTFRLSLPLCITVLFAGSIWSRAQARTPGTANPLASPGSAATAYRAVQHRLAHGWNTWDVNSMTTHVLLPEGLAIQVGLKNNTTEGGDDF